MKRDDFHVAVMVETSRHYGREVTRGISAFVAEHGHWHIYQQERSLVDRLPSWFTDWHGDGILFHSLTHPVCRDILRQALPAVSLTILPEEWVSPQSRIPMFGVDPGAVADMAADFLLLCGFRSFAFCGLADQPFSQERETMFVNRLQKEDRPCRVIHLDYDFDTWSDSLQAEVAGTEKRVSLSEILGGLAPETAVFACNDDVARRVVHACREQGIRVPNELAVMGVDNDPVICGMLTPNITSIEADPFRIGYLAARRLDRMLRTGRTGRMRKLIAPLRVVERASTDVVVARDPLVRDAARLIRDEATVGLTAEDLVARLGVSRTTLENRFRRELHCSIHDLILTRRLEMAKRLLEETQLLQADIAARAGFLNVSHFSRTFHRRYGTTPGEHRRRYAVR